MPGTEPSPLCCIAMTPDWPRVCTVAAYLSALAGPLLWRKDRAMDLTPQKLESLPLETQLLRYHEIAEEFVRRAGLATDEKERADLLKLVDEWLVLAAATES